VIGRLEGDRRVLVAVSGTLMAATVVAAVLGFTGRTAAALAVVALLTGAVSALLLLLVRRTRFIIDRLRDGARSQPAAVPYEPPAPTRLSPDEALRRAVPLDAIGRRPDAGHEDVPFDPLHDRLWWYVPGFGIGSGGHANILNMVAELERAGLRSTIVLTDVRDPREAREMRGLMIANYDPTFAGVTVRSEVDLRAGDVLVATDWRSVRPVVEDRGRHRAHYFVQDHEVEFTATGTWSVLAADTYRAGLMITTLSQGLADLLAQRYDVDATWIPLPVDPSVYGTEPGPPSAVVARVRAANPDRLPVLAVYGRPGTARRGVELAIAGLEHAARDGARFLCVLFGEDVALEGVTFPWMSVGVQPPRELAALYRSASAGVVLSLTNPSLVPQEMLACGLPVIEADTPLTRSSFGTLPGCHLTPPHPERLASTVVRLIGGPDAPPRPRVEPPLPTHEEAVRPLLGALVGRELPAPSSLDLAPSVTVAILTRDPDPATLQRVVAAVERQRYPGRLEVRIVDSDSAASVRSGQVRNDVVAASDTDLVAFLTHQTVPIGDRWLFDLAAACSVDDRIAGAFSRHEPSATAPRVAAVALVERFDRLPQAFERPSMPRTASSTGELDEAQQFFPGTACVVRRAAWAQVPFRDVMSGEAELWAHDVLGAGWSLTYAHRSRVEHMDATSEADQQERARIATACRMKHWGEELSEERVVIAAAFERARARRIVDEYRLGPDDHAVELAAIAAREESRRRAVADLLAVAGRVKDL